MKLNERMYFTRPMIAQSLTIRVGVDFACCLKIINQKGEELSLALDNSAGAHDIAWRGDVRIYDKSDQQDFDEIAPAPERFLEILAKHLGYKVEKIPACRCCASFGTESQTHTHHGDCMAQPNPNPLDRCNWE